MLSRVEHEKTFITSGLGHGIELQSQALCSVYSAHDIFWNVVFFLGVLHTRNKFANFCDDLTHFCRMNFSTLSLWTDPFPI